MKWVLSGPRTAAEHPRIQPWPRRSAEDKLRELLQEAGIPLDVPKELDAVVQFVAGEPSVIDGPSALVRVRNRLLHPNAGEPYRHQHLLVQTWGASSDPGG